MTGRVLWIALAFLVVPVAVASAIEPIEQRLTESEAGALSFDSTTLLLHASLLPVAAGDRVRVLRSDATNPEEIPTHAFRPIRTAGATDGDETATWYRYLLRNAAADPLGVVLDFGFADTDYLPHRAPKVWVRRPGEAAEELPASDHVKIGAAQPRYPYVGVGLSLEPLSLREVFLRVPADARRVRVAAKVLSAEQAFLVARREYLTDAILLGVACALFLYHLFLFLKRPTSWTGHYAALLGVYALYFAIATLILPTKVGPTWNLVLHYLWPVTTAVGLALIALYLRGVLNTRQTLPRIHKVLTGVVVTALVFAPIVSLGQDLPWITVSAYVAQVAVVLVLLAVTIVAVVRRVPGSGYVAFAWAFYLAAVVVNQLAALGAYRSTSLLRSVPDYAAPITMILLALAVADRYDRDRIEKERIAAERNRLEAEQAARSALLARVAHEIRTPLQLILDPVRLVAGGRRGSRVDIDDPLFAVIARNGRRLAERVDRLLDLARGGHHPECPCPAATPIVRSLRVVASQFEHRLQEKRISWILDTGDVPAGLTVYHDPEMLDTMLSNIISNAIRYSPAESEIRATLREKDGSVLVAICDEGPGISAEYADEVFRPFVRLAPESAGESGETGFGVGLAIVKRLAELNGDTVVAKPRAEGGTRFEIWFPQPPSDGVEGCVDPAESRGEAAATSPDLDGGTDPGRRKAEKRRPPTVAVMEDNDDLREYLVELLSEGFEVYPCAHGRECLDLLRGGVDVDLVVSDLSAPVLDGWALLEEMKSHLGWRGIPVIIVTAHGSHEDQSRALKMGAVDYLTKPFNGHDLVTKVGTILRHRSIWSRSVADGAPVLSEAARHLTARQQRVVEGLLDGRTRKEIADEMEVSLSTVKRHVEDIYRRTGVNSRFELFAVLAGSDGQDDPEEPDPKDR